MVTYPDLFDGPGWGVFPPRPTPTPTASPPLVPPSDGLTRTLQVPILMYHYVSTPPDRNDALRNDLSVSPQALAEQLGYLRAEGYSGITLDELVLALTAGERLPPKPVVLTFDDGHLDHYEHAFPILRASGFRATFFVVTSFLDQERPEYLSWDQVREMHAGGMRIESHAYTHVDLRHRDVDYLVWQMLGSKEAIEERTGRPVRFFCYPAGHYDDLAIEVLRSANYWGAATITQGVTQTTDNRFELQRLRVRGSYSLAQFAALLDGGTSSQTDGPVGYGADGTQPAPTVMATPSPISSQ